MFYSVISCFSILILITGFVYVIAKLSNRSRRERVEFVRTFKSGQCVFILLPTLILVFMGVFYSSHSLSSLFKAIPLSMKFVVFDFETGEMEDLLKVNIIYKSALYLDCFLIIFNACMLFLSIFKECVHNKNINRRFLKTKKSIVLIFGLSEENKAIYTSSPEDSERFIYAPLSKEEKSALYIESINYLSLHEDDVLGRLSSFIKKRGKNIMSRQRVNVFINTGDDTRNIILSDKLLSRIKSLGEKDPAYTKISVYMFGSNGKKNLYIELEEKGKGCFHYVDEYRIAALDLIENQPIASFFNEKQLNKDTTIKSDVEIKVFMVGFGNSNRELFLQSVANDQFVTTDDNGKPCHMNVKYYLFDRKKILENSNLNFSYNRYKDFLSWIDKKGIQDQFLEVAPLPCEEHLIPMQDIESKSFLNNLYDNLAFGQNDINFISVSLGCDIESIDLANKIVGKTMEWGLDNTHVGVRVRNIEDADNIAEESILLWGDRKHAVFNYTSITRKKLEQMAMVHDGVYDKYSQHYKKDIIIPADEMERMKNRVEWFSDKRMNRIKRESSIYACLNLKTKLCISGLNRNDLTYEMIDKTIGKDNNEPIDKEKNKKRDNLARQEHYRWNAFYIVSGFIPVPIKDMLKDKKAHGKDLKRRRHPNLIECDALVEYEKLTNNCVIQYDYLSIDELADMFNIFDGV